MGRSFGEDYLRWSAEWQSPLRGHLLFDHAREPANFVASRGKTTGRSERGDNGGRLEGVASGLSEPGDNGGRVEGVPTGLSEPGDNGGRVEGVPSGRSKPGEISSVKHRGRKEKPRGFRRAAFMRVDQTFSVLRGTKSRGWIRLGDGGG